MFSRPLVMTGIFVATGITGLVKYRKLTTHAEQNRPKLCMAVAFWCNPNVKGIRDFGQTGVDQTHQNYCD